MVIKRFLKSVLPTYSLYKQLSTQDKRMLDAIRELLTANVGAIQSTNLLKEIEFVVFDTETTGFHAYGGDRIISIGAVKWKNGTIVDQFYQLVNPNRTIPEEIEVLTGIKNQDVMDMPSIYEGIYQFLLFAGEHILVAHHADFDMHFLNLPLRRFLGSQIPSPVIDTMMLSYHLNPSLPTQDLDTILEAYKIPIKGRHHALGDSLMTAQLVQQFIAQLEKERGIITIGGLRNSMPSICRQQHSYLFKKNLEINF